MEKEELSTVVDTLAKDTQKKVSGIGRLGFVSGILASNAGMFLYNGIHNHSENLKYAGAAAFGGALICILAQYFKNKGITENIDALSYLTKKKGDE